jgi:hypothetical protein
LARVGLLDPLRDEHVELAGTKPPRLAQKTKRRPSGPIHDYLALDSRIVQAIVTGHLDDFRAFAAPVVDRFGV